MFEAGEAYGVLFIAMRYVPGGDAGACCDARARCRPPGSADHLPVASALDAAHEHDLVHRDVKPANMLWTPAAAAAGPGRPVRARLPFRLRHQQAQLASAALTAAGQFVGTLDYIAPEQIEGQRIDGRADQYSLACAAFELLAGARPFRKDTQLGADLRRT